MVAQQFLEHLGDLDLISINFINRDVAAILP